MLPILLISPMPTITALAPQVAAALGMEIFIETSDDAGAVAAVQRYPQVEVVVSRGGIAERVKALPGVSVVEISMSINELLSNLHQLTAKGLRRIGIVSRANFFGGASGDFRILDVEVCIRPQVDEQAIAATVQQLVREGFQGIIGCRAAYNTACELGVEAIFLESGEISLRNALCEARRILAAKAQEKLQAAQLAAIIDNIDEAVVTFTQEQQVGFFNRHARRLCQVSSLETVDFKPLLAVFPPGEKELVTSINGHNVIARWIPLEFDGMVRGQVVTLQEVAHIHASESKIRSSLYKKGLYARYRFEDLIGDSAVLRQLVERAKTYALHDSNVLIEGETGTGKEVFAQSMHHHSRRRKGPFVSVNIASIPPSLLESELFGYVEGAFTGARKGGKPGLFEMAHEGTLFLDEIGEMAPEIQSRLLRVLQEREVMRIGDDKIIPVDARIISATNRDLFGQTQAGKFRLDLYYRIHVVGLRIPPLRERRDDIPLIFEYFLRQFCGQQVHVAGLSPAAREALKSYAWPGNVRQLRNVAEVAAYDPKQAVEGAFISGILREQGCSSGESNFMTLPEKGSLKEMETAIIRHLLAHHSADAVCQRLGISRVTLWRKMNRERS